MNGARATGPRAAAGLVVLALAAVAIGTAAHGRPLPPVRPSPLTAAPEPAVAPPLTTTPAGTVLALPDAPEPEGVVVDSAGLAAVATRHPGRLVLVDVAAAVPAAVPGAVTGAVTGPVPRVVRTVIVPGAARHLQLAGPDGPVLVPGEDTDTLAEVALPSGAVLRTTTVGRQPHDAAPAAGAVVLSDELGNATSVLRDGRVVAVLPGPLQPGGVGASGERAAVVDVRGRLTFVYDTTHPALVAELPAGAGPTHTLDLGGGVQVVADTDGGALILTRITGVPAVLGTVPLPGKPYGMAVDAARHRLWITTTADNRLVQLTIGGTPEAPTLAVARSFPTVRQANSVAVWPVTGRVVVAGATPAGTLQVLDP